MAIPKIELPLKTYTPWLTGLCACLDRANDLGLAYVVRVDLPEIRYVPRWNQGAVLRVNGRYVYLDTWDHHVPTNQVHPQQPFGNIELFIKIQATKDWTAHCCRMVAGDTPDLSAHDDPMCPGGVPVTPWTMFHTAQMDWLANLDRRREARLLAHKRVPWGFTGRNWGDRASWVQVLRDHPEKGHISLWDGRARTGTTEDWVAMVNTWCIGIVLQGKHSARTDGKNRREVEFAGLGIPMILNYQPHYPDPLIPGTHYVLWKEPHRFPLMNALAEAQDRAVELANNARQWWERNASVEGVCRSFIKIVEARP